MAERNTARVAAPTTTTVKGPEPSQSPEQFETTPEQAFLHLAQAVGNQAMLGLLRSGLIQPKLRVGTPDDAYECEANRVADQVMRMPDPGIYRKPT